jgi:hypothetical protein
METSGQIQTPAPQSPGRKLLVSIAEEAEWAAAPVWTLWRREKSLIMLGIKPQFPCHPSFNLAIILMELFQQ